LDKIILLMAAVAVAIWCEVTILDAISAAGITGIAGFLLSAALPGSFIYYLLTHADQS
jgi:hypothetical protein